MTAAEQLDLMSLEDYIRLYDLEGPFEIINGERKPLMPTVPRHGFVIRILFRILDAFCTTRMLGEVFTELPYALTYHSNWVKGSRVPDVMFFAAERWKPYTDNTKGWMDIPFLIVPDLVIEVVSANDRYSEISDKVELYRTDGVKLIWVVDPFRKRVTVHAGDFYSTLSEGDVLGGGEVLPELAITLAELFAGQEEA